MHLFSGFSKLFRPNEPVYQYDSLQLSNYRCFNAGQAITTVSLLEFIYPFIKCIHLFIHPSICPCIYSFIHPFFHKHMFYELINVKLPTKNTCTCMHTIACMPTHACMHAHSCVHACIHTNKNACTNIRNTYKHMYTYSSAHVYHTHTHTHTHTYKHKHKKHTYKGWSKSSEPKLLREMTVKQN